MDIYVASAFAKDGKGGNKAGVMVENIPETAAEKLNIARIMGYSETAFVGKSDNADFKLEYFSPAEEVPLCGHATIATFTVLHQLGKLNKSGYTIETRAGILRIKLQGDMIFMEQNLPEFSAKLSENDFADIINITDIGKNYPIQIVSTGLRDIMLPIKDEKALSQLKPDFAAMTELSRAKNVVGVHAFALKNDSITAVCRNFAPLYDIDEESATGTSNCALAGYLWNYGIKKDRYIFEQGYELGSPSEIIVDISNEGDEITSVFVGGKGYVNEIRKI
ncbi:MAG: PhzF family phenazine biosynthesis protein [Clostridia bacterium]|nr:PhzF family phenazine biosynthesis protein [Clostridia bacterium]